ncbi:hypothetical protein MettiDRAFT_0824 [Methanolobus tindarius DSM 2278]|uniref:Uncharacterized protein n=1 Tax=Methanolobus tindarius DSM 2278 TaxID=1090322 RepID=W9DQ50_METTI|nr:hypothetical protein [Methanolobus tindarius]ETA67400.1 hypothetical protein MettiDRAFT_0824 [Methanolobus tindarius DSM 2278]
MSLWICIECQDGTHCLVSGSLPPKECVISPTIGDSKFCELVLEDHDLKREARERGFHVINEKDLKEVVHKLAEASEALDHVVEEGI